MNQNIMTEALDYFRAKIQVEAFDRGSKQFFPLFDIMHNRRIVIMPGETDDTKGIKCLYADDYASERKGIIYGFSNKYGSFEYDGCIITALRTVLVTLIAITNDPNFGQYKNIEIIGYKGRIGNYLMYYLERILNLNISGIGRDQVLIGKDIAISVTSNINKLFLKPIHPENKLVITLDAGYYFDQSVLSLANYGDDCNSLNKNINLEFPFYKTTFFDKSLFGNEYKNDHNRKAVHIVGSGYYDILLCEFCLDNGISNLTLAKVFEMHSERD